MVSRSITLECGDRNLKLPNTIPYTLGYSPLFKASDFWSSLYIKILFTVSKFVSISLSSRQFRSPLTSRLPAQLPAPQRQLGDQCNYKLFFRLDKSVSEQYITNKRLLFTRGAGWSLITKVITVNWLILLVRLDDFLTDNSIKKSVNVYSMVEEQV